MHAIADPCPCCGGCTILPSRWRLEDIAPRFRWLRPLRCHTCGERVYTRLFASREAHSRYESREVVLRIRFRNPSRLLRALVTWASDPPAEQRIE
jgi:hypothetical protein